MTENDELIRVDEKMGSNIQTGNKPTRSSNLGEYVKKGGPGRPVGSRNKIPGDLRADLMTVFEQLGGVERMVEWAQASNANQGQFYRMWVSTLPKQVEANLRHHNDLSLCSNEELERIIQRGQDRARRRAARAGLPVEPRELSRVLLDDPSGD